jgi:hypothetical protein
MLYLLLAVAACASPVTMKTARSPSHFLAKLPKNAMRKSSASRTRANVDLRSSLPTGATDPAPYFDPLNLAEGTDENTLKRWREAELTHGRVAMLSALGWLTAESFHPLFGGDIEGPAIDHFQLIDERVPRFWELILFTIGLFESYRSTYGWKNPVNGGGLFELNEDYTPGDLNFDPLGLTNDISEAELTELKNKELNNGRLAMVSLLGLIAQEAVNHETIIDTWRQILQSEERSALSLTNADFQENVKNIDPNYLKTPEMKYDPSKVAEVMKELPKL